MSDNLPVNPPSLPTDLPTEGKIEQIARAEIQRASDPLAEKEQQFFSSGKPLRNAEREFKLGKAKSILDTRLSYLSKLFWLIVGWLLFVVVSVVLSGFHVGNFELSDYVLIALITSTTTTVIGLFIIAAKWLYPATQD
jgi:hypothetical protein